MKKHTQRVIGILKQVIKDLNEQEAKGTKYRGDGVDVLAYTAKTTTPNILRHDVEMMIKELECKCGHPNGMFTDNFAPETCCPDQLITFSNGGKQVSVNCSKICCHHLQYMEWSAFESDKNISN